MRCVYRMALYWPTTLQSYLCVYVSFVCHRVWYHTLSLRYAWIQSLGIILNLYATLVPNFDSVAELACGEKLRTQSLTHSINQSPSLFDSPGTEAFS